MYSLARPRTCFQKIFEPSVGLVRAPGWHCEHRAVDRGPWSELGYVGLARMHCERSVPSSDKNQSHVSVLGSIVNVALMFNKKYFLMQMFSLNGLKPIDLLLNPFRK